MRAFSYKNSNTLPLRLRFSFKLIGNGIGTGHHSAAYVHVDVDARGHTIFNLCLLRQKCFTSDQQRHPETAKNNSQSSRDSIQSVNYMFVYQMRLMECCRTIAQKFSSSEMKKMTMLTLDQINIQQMGMEWAGQLDLDHVTVSTVIAPHLLILKFSLRKLVLGSTIIQVHLSLNSRSSKFNTYAQVEYLKTECET